MPEASIPLFSRNPCRMSEAAASDTLGALKPHARTMPARQVGPVVCTNVQPATLESQRTAVVHQLQSKSWELGEPRLPLAASSTS